MQQIKVIAGLLFSILFALPVLALLLGYRPWRDQSHSEYHNDPLVGTSTSPEARHRQTHKNRVTMRPDPMIALLFPDGSERQLSDEEARRLADLLWEVAAGSSTATVAVAIQSDLRRRIRGLERINVPEGNAARVSEALARL